jgi:hypothetical protein
MAGKGSVIGTSLGFPGREFPLLFDGFCNFRCDIAKVE